MADAVRNTIELNIYDEDLEIVKTYKTYGIRWKTCKKILSMRDELDALMKAEDDEAIEKLNEIIKLVYPNITDEHLDEAYTDDLYKCCNQAMKIANDLAKNS